MRIGEAARLAGVNVQTLRFYERQRLLDSPQRAPSGYRHYSIEAVQRVRLVKWFQTLGFSLADIREMLPARLDTSSKAAIRAKARGKILELKKQITALQSIGRTLEEVSNCDCAAECPLVAAAMDGTTPAATRVPSRVKHSRRKAMKGLSVGILIAALTLISSASLPAPIARAAQPHFTMSMTKQKSKSDRSAKADEKYDFVCRLDALDANERKRHSELTKLLKSGIKQTLELRDGYALQLPSDTASVLATTEWVTMERRCCEFFNFELELESGDGAFWLRITGRKGVKDFLRSELGLKAN